MTRQFTNGFSKPSKVEVKHYNMNKHEKASELAFITTIENIVSVTVFTATDEEMSMIGYNEYDPNHEYCTVVNNCKESQIFRNSYVNVAKW